MVELCRKEYALERGMEEGQAGEADEQRHTVVNVHGQLVIVSVVELVTS